MEIRAYRNGDEEGIVALLSGLGWHGLKGYPEWRWEYAKEENSAALIAVAEHEDVIIGHYAAIPMTIRIGVERIPAAKVEGSAVDASFRGGVIRKWFPEEECPTLFGKLVQQLFVQADRNGIDLLWAFPNEAARGLQLRYGYEEMILPLRELVYPLNVRRVVSGELKVRLKNSLLADLAGVSASCYANLRSFFLKVLKKSSSISVDRLERFDTRIDAFFESLAPLGDITIDRDAAYLNWRFIDNPHGKHFCWSAQKSDKIFGYLVARLDFDKKQGQIVDLMAEGKEALVLLMEEVLSFMKTREIDSVVMWTTPTNSRSKVVEEVARRFGLWFARTKKLPVILRLRNREAIRSHLLDPERWYVTMAFTEGA